MCREFICATCELVSWRFCEKASAFETCPEYSYTTYKTERLCETCERIGTAIDELYFWLARHPARAVSYQGTEEDETLSVVSFYDSDHEEMKKKMAAAKPDSPWGMSTAPTNWEDEEEEKEKEGPGLSEHQEEEDQDDSYEFEDTENEGDIDFEAYNPSSSEICMGW